MKEAFVKSFSYSLELMSSPLTAVTFKGGKKCNLTALESPILRHYTWCKPLFDQSLLAEESQSVGAKESNLVWSESAVTFPRGPCVIQSAPEKPGWQSQNDRHLVQVSVCLSLLTLCCFQSVLYMPVCTSLAHLKSSLSMALCSC